MRLVAAPCLNLKLACDPTAARPVGGQMT